MAIGRWVSLSDRQTTSVNLVALLMAVLLHLSLALFCAVCLRSLSDSKSLQDVKRAPSVHVRLVATEYPKFERGNIALRNSTRLDTPRLLADRSLSELSAQQAVLLLSGLPVISFTAELPHLPQTTDLVRERQPDNWNLPAGGRPLRDVGKPGADRPITSEPSFPEESAPWGEPAAVALFGSDPVVGRSFVFLIDGSASMGPAGLNILSEVRSQMHRILESLTEKQRVCCAVYRGGLDLDFPLGRHLIPLEPGPKAAYREWLDQIVAFGRTNHEAAIHAALDIGPEVIVVLSDAGDPGLTRAEQQHLISRAVESTCRIVCIEFGRGPLRETSSCFQMLAKATGGTWRYVDVDKPNP